MCFTDALNLRVCFTDALNLYPLGTMKARKSRKIKCFFFFFFLIVLLSNDNHNSIKSWGDHVTSFMPVAFSNVQLGRRTVATLFIAMWVHLEVSASTHLHICVTDCARTGNLSHCLHSWIQNRMQETWFGFVFNRFNSRHPVPLFHLDL